MEDVSVHGRGGFFTSCSAGVKWITTAQLLDYVFMNWVAKVGKETPRNHWNKKEISLLKGQTLRNKSEMS